MESRDIVLEEEGFQLEKYWRLVKPRIHWPIIISLILVLGAFIRSSLRVPLYVSSGLLMIQPEKDIINFGNPYGFADYRNEYFNTQLRILQSRSLSKAVEEEIGVSSSGVSITPIDMTRLVEISYTSSDPVTAARIVNTLFDKFIEFNLDVKTRSSKEASEFIGKQITELRNNLAQKEQELGEYSKRKDLFYLSKKDSTEVEKFSDLNKAYTQAQINRVNKESLYKQLQGLKFENYPVIKENDYITSLKNSYSSLESEYRKKAQIFKESYPEMVQLRNQMEPLQKKIDQEIRERAVKTLNEARQEFQAAKKKEDSLLQLLNQQKGVMVTSKTNAIYYNSLDIEVTNMRTLLDYLVKKQKESLLSSKMEGLQTTNIRIIDRAEVPQTPISSKKTRSLTMSFILGFAIGIGLIFLVDYFDRSIKNPEDVKMLLGVPALGFIPSNEGKSGNSYYSYYYGSKKREPIKGQIQNIELVNHRDTESPFSENYRSIRTSIQLSTPKEPPRILSMSSAMPSEGKTATVTNLAVSFSQLGKKVVLVDGDMRKPRVHKVFKLKNTVGLSSFLAGRVELNEIIQKTEVPNVFVITSGPIPPNPAELIDSEIMTNLLERLLDKVDFVFIDTPPLIGIVDPILIGKHSDGMILVSWAGKTSRDVIKKAKEEVDRFGIRILGVILNKLDFKKSDATSYSYAYKYNYSYKYKED